MRRTSDFWTENDDLIDTLTQQYSSYRNVDKSSITSWLNQFNSDEDATVGLKLLENLNFYPQNRIHSLFRTLKATLDGQFKGANFYYCGFGHPGTSGDSMLHEFRIANPLTESIHNDSFIHMSDIASLDGPEEKIVIMIDDVCGSGKQARAILKNILETVPPNVKLVFCPLIIPLETSNTLKDEFEILIISPSILEEKDKFFSAENTLFEIEEKATILRYCRRATSRPRGFGNTEMTVLIVRNIPNNTISILRANTRRWKGLFKRNS